MAMQWLENELRTTGDPRDSAFADVVAGIHKSRRSDISLPTPTIDGVTATTVQTPESHVEIKRFSDEQREALKKEGYIVYGLTGQSIKTERDAYRPLWSIWHNSYLDFEALSSMHSEVAINPDKLFLRESNNKTLNQQEALVAKFSQELGKKVQGVKAVIGDAADYIELTFTHLDATTEQGYPVRLFGEDYEYNYARTKTPTGVSSVASVGSFFAKYGLLVSRWDAGFGNNLVYVVPLVVPA